MLAQIKQEEMVGRTIRAVFDLDVDEHILLTFTDDTFIVFTSHSHGYDGADIRVNARSLSLEEGLEYGILTQSEYQEGKRRIEQAAQEKIDREKRITEQREREQLAKLLAKYPKS